MNATATKKPARKVERSAKVTQPFAGATVLWLTVGKDSTAYLVKPLASAFGTAFRLVRADKGDGGAEYDVLLNGSQSSCECQGFLRHGMCKDGHGCKHIAGLTAASAAGSLQTAPVASKPVPAPAVPKSDTCFNCDRPEADCQCFI